MAWRCLAEWEPEAEWAPGLERPAGWPGPLAHGKGRRSQSRLCAMTIPCWGLRWLSSAAHAVLDVHKAQALPAFPLLCHLGLKGAHRSGQVAQHPLSTGTGEGLVHTLHHHTPLPLRSSCCSALAAGQGPPGCRDVSPRPLSSISASQTPDLVQLGKHPTYKRSCLSSFRPSRWRGGCAGQEGVSRRRVP